MKTKFKIGFWKWIFFAGAIIFIMAYTFTITLPKSAQMAKEELLSDVFGINSKDTVIDFKNDTIPANKLGGYINNDVKIEEALKSLFNYHNIDVLYVGIPESMIPVVFNGKLEYINIDTELRARRVKFKTDKGNEYNVYVIYNRLTGEVSNVINDERFIEKEVEKIDTIQYGEEGL